MVEFAEWQTALNNTRMRQAVLQEAIEEMKEEKPDAEKLRKAKAVIADFTKEVDENLAMIKGESANCQWQEPWQEPQWRKDLKDLQKLGEILYPWESEAEKAECLEYLEKNSPENKMIEIFERIEKCLQTLATQPPERKAADNLTDEDCIKRLADTGFIMMNPRIKDKTIYLIKKGHNALDTFDELAKITGSERRARNIMIQNMTGIATTLNTHRPKHSLKT
jgi:hypothetical protein